MHLHKYGNGLVVLTIFCGLLYNLLTIVCSSIQFVIAARYNFLVGKQSIFLASSACYDAISSL